MKWKFLIVSFVSLSVLLFGVYYFLNPEKNEFFKEGVNTLFICCIKKPALVRSRPCNIF